MRSTGEQHQSFVAWSLIGVGLALAATGILYIRYNQREQYFPAINAPANPVVSELTAPIRMLFVSCLLLIMFVIGSFLIIRVGRLFVQRGAPRTRPQYVDAWSSYRLTEAEIEAAGHQLERTASESEEGPDPKPPA